MDIRQHPRVAFVLLDGEVTGGQVVAHQLMQGLREAGGEALAVFPRSGPMVSAYAQTAS